MPLMFFIFFSGFLKLTDAGALTNQEADGGNLRSLFFFGLSTNSLNLSISFWQKSSSLSDFRFAAERSSMCCKH
jgi:hypothetical protein